MVGTECDLVVHAKNVNQFVISYWLRSRYQYGYSVKPVESQDLWIMYTYSTV